VLEVRSKAVSPHADEAPKRYLLYHPYDYNYIVSWTDSLSRYKVSPLPLWDGVYTTPGKIIAHLGYAVGCQLSTLRVSTSVSFEDLKNCAPKATWKVGLRGRAVSVNVHGPDRRFDTQNFAVRIGEEAYVAMEAIPVRYQSPIPWVMPSYIGLDDMVSLDDDIAMLEGTQRQKIISKLQSTLGISATSTGVDMFTDLTAKIPRWWRKDGSISFSYMWRSVSYGNYDTLKSAVTSFWQQQQPWEQDHVETVVIDDDDTDEDDDVPIEPSRKRHARVSRDNDDTGVLLRRVRSSMSKVESAFGGLKEELSARKDLMEEMKSRLSAEVEASRLEIERLKNELAQEIIRRRVAEEELETRGPTSSSSSVHHADPFGLALSLFAFISGHDVMDNGYVRLEDRLAHALASENDATVIKTFHARMHAILDSAPYVIFLKTLFWCDIFKSRSNVHTLLAASGASMDMYPAIMECYRSANPRKSLAILFRDVRNIPRPTTLAECCNDALLVVLDSLA
jgi:hypothetical protein